MGQPRLRVLVPQGVKITQYDTWVVCVSAPPVPKKPKHSCMWVAVEAFENKGEARAIADKILAAYKSSAVIALNYDNLFLASAEGHEYIPHT